MEEVSPEPAKTIWAFLAPMCPSGPNVLGGWGKDGGVIHLQCREQTGVSGFFFQKLKLGNPQAGSGTSSEM